MRLIAPVIIFIIFLVMALLAGCESATHPQDQPAPSDSVSVYIDAAEGGQVNLSGIGKGAVLTIPPGAMAESGNISAVASTGPAAGTMHLRPGDGLYVMSGDETGYQFPWRRGHVGMVSYANPDSAVTTVVESTVGRPQQDGVQTNPLLRFKRADGHLYLGARRPPGAVLNHDLRETSLLEARSHLGEPYAFLGGDFGGYNCTGLLEAGWDAIERGVMGTQYRFIFPTEMYNATEPVTEIEVRVGEELRIPVYPVVISPRRSTRPCPRTSWRATTPTQRWRPPICPRARPRLWTTACPTTRW